MRKLEVAVADPRAVKRQHDRALLSQDVSRSVRRSDHPAYHDDHRIDSAARSSGLLEAGVRFRIFRRSHQGAKSPDQPVDFRYS